ncbi:MAG: hypothetical protein IK990_19165 [Ruminiclostridium sp.]|nr:hypothetical protein [Ruminiclostridium sp.]
MRLATANRNRREICRAEPKRSGNFRKKHRYRFKSDLTTPLPEHIDNGETEIHVFYAKKMGEKYLERYNRYFKSPVIHEQDMRHEEFLGVYPKEWCELVRKICL